MSENNDSSGLNLDTFEAVTGEDADNDGDVDPDPSETPVIDEEDVSDSDGSSNTSSNQEQQIVEDQQTEAAGEVSIKKDRITSGGETEEVIITGFENAPVTSEQEAEAQQQALREAAEQSANSSRSEALKETAETIENVQKKAGAPATVRPAKNGEGIEITAEKEPEPSTTGKIDRTNSQNQNQSNILPDIDLSKVRGIKEKRKTAFTAGNRNIFPQQTASTQREFASGTNIPGESFFNRDKSFSGIPGTGFQERNITNPFGNKGFNSPTGKATRTEQNVEDFLTGIGAPERFSSNVAESVAVTETLGRGTVQGVAQAPEDIQELIQDPEEKLGEEAEAFRRGRSGQIADTPQQAVLLSGTRFQEQAQLGSEAIDAGIGLAGITSAGSGVASGGAVRGVNAPTLRASEPDIETESFQGRVFESRVAASETDVGPEGQVVRNQEFEPVDAEGQTAGVIGESETVGQSEQPLQFVQVSDPEGERLFAGRTTSSFVADDEETSGLAQTNLLEIGDGQELKDLEDVESSTRFQDFRINTRDDERLETLIQGSEGRQEFKNIESAVFGEGGGQDIRGISQVDVSRDTGAGTVQTFTRSTGAERESGTQLAEGQFVEIGNIDQSRVRRRIDLDRFLEDQEFGDLSEQRQREIVQQLEQLGEDIFGENRRSRDTGTAEETGFNEREVDSEGQSLVQEESRERTVDEVADRLGIGTDRVSRELTEEAARREVLEEFNTDLSGATRLDTGTGLGLAQGSATASGVSTSTEELTGIENDIVQDQDAGQGIINRNFQDNFLREEQEEDLGQDNILRLDSDQDQQQLQERERPPQDLEFRPPDDNPPFGGGGGGDFDQGDDEDNGDGLFDLLSREQDRNLRRSIGSDILDLESDEDLTEQGATNPLSLRPL